MPTIAQKIADNQARIAAGGKTGTGVGPEIVQAPITAAPTPPQDLPAGGGLPQRGMFPADLTLNSDRSDSNRAFRGAGVRSSTFPYAPSASPTSTVIEKSQESSGGSSSSSPNLTAGPGISITPSSNGSTEVSGTPGTIGVPDIFSVSGAFPVTSFPNGGIALISLVDEPAGTFFAGPELSGPGSSPILDVQATNSSSSATSLPVGPVTPSNAGDFALAIFSPGFNFGSFSPSGWTQESTTDLNTQGVIFHTVLPDTSPITPTCSFTGGSTACAGSVVLLSAPEGIPTIVNTYKSPGNTNLANGTNTVTLNPTTSGNSLIFIFIGDQGGATTTNPVTDGGGDNFVHVSRVIDSGTNHVIDVWVAYNIVAGTTSLSFNNSNNNQAARYCIYEITNLLPSAGIPTFRYIVNSDLDGAVFGATGTGHNAGAVPDPGGTSHTPPYYLGDDAAFHPITPMTTLGDMVYENATPVPARLAGNTSTIKNFLTQTGTGSASAVPVWGAVAASDLPGYISINLTGQTASVSLANLLASVPVGMYRLSYYLYCTAGAVAGQVIATFGWTDDTGDAESVTTSAVSLITVGSGDFAQGEVVLYAEASSDITYETTVSGVTGNPQYALRMRLEYLG